MMVVRTMHNIKGTAPMVGFNALPDIAIPIEQAYKEVLNNNLAINSSMVEKTKSAVYILQQMLIEEETHTVHSEEEKSVLIDYFNAING
jgi:chemotaxis protein histidine kinase CheA